MANLEQLHARLDAVEAGLSEAVDAAAVHMTAYQDELQRFIETRGRNVSPEALDALQKRQNTVLEAMRSRRQAIGDALRKLHRQGSASRAYAAMDVAP